MSAVGWIVGGVAALGVGYIGYKFYQAATAPTVVDKAISFGEGELKGGAQGVEDIPSSIEGLF